MMHGYFDEDPGRYQLWPLGQTPASEAARWEDPTGLVALAAAIAAARWGEAQDPARRCPQRDAA
jgi:hypothetical protein